MTTCLGKMRVLQIIKIIPILFCRTARIFHIVNNDSLYLLKAIPLRLYGFLSKKSSVISGLPQGPSSAGSTRLPTSLPSSCFGEIPDTLFGFQRKLLCKIEINTARKSIVIANCLLFDICFLPFRFFPDFFLFLTLFFIQTCFCPLEKNIESLLSMKYSMTAFFRILLKFYT